MPQTPAERKRKQRSRDRARLGDKVYKRVEAGKMKRWRASKRQPKPAQPPPAPAPPPQPPAQPPQQPQAVKPNKKNQQKPKAPKQFQRAPQQVVKDFVPLYKLPNATQNHLYHYQNLLFVVRKNIVLLLLRYIYNYQYHIIFKFKYSIF